MYKKHSTRERIKAVRLCESGQSYQTVGQLLGINNHYIAEWHERYKLYGMSGLQKQAYHRYSYEEKVKIICEIQNKHVPLHIISAKYRISQSCLEAWCRIVGEKGYAGLQETKQRGRPRKAMGRPKKQEPQTELEKLQEEVEYLRAENAYLKKLRALVIEEEERKRKLKSSNH